MPALRVSHCLASLGRTAIRLRRDGPRLILPCVQLCFQYVQLFGVNLLLSPGEAEEEVAQLDQI